jgi:hypothetical protein
MHERHYPKKGVSPMLIPQQGQRIKMLGQALKDKAPRLYRELKAEKQLMPFLIDREQQMMDAYHDAMFNVVEKWKRENQYLLRQGKGLEFLQKHRQLIGKVTEETLATFLEFSDPEK